MVRSSRPLVVLFCALLLAACGGETEAPPPVFRLAIESPAAGSTEVPFPGAVVRGVATEVRTLSLRVSAGDEICGFEARPGITLAFAARGKAPAPRMALPGVEREDPTLQEQARALKERLSDVAPEATVREPVGASAFLVDLPAGRDDQIAAVVAATAPAPQLLFLMQVLPRERYRLWRDGQVAPRLRDGASLPWSGSTEAFDAFKEAEVARWKKAREDGVPYEPSRDDLLVVPKAATDATDARHFAVLEWPANEAHRFGGHILTRAEVTTAMRGEPAVLYDVREAYQGAFREWTGANIGLPMAIVIDGEYQSAPVIQSALSDTVQIHLGSGSWAELRREAEVLAQQLGGIARGVPTALVAACTWGPGGGLEVLLPLEERVDTKLEIEATGSGADEQVRVARTLRRVPGARADAAATVEARLAEMRLGVATAEVLAPLLRDDADAAIEALSAVASSDAATERRLASIRLLGLVDPASTRAAEALVAGLDAGEPDIVRAAIRALEGPARHTRAAFDGLLRVAAGEDEALRHEAAGLLDATDPPQRDWVLAAARDPEPGVRAAALSALAEQAGVGHLPLLLEGARDADSRVRRAAAIGLLMLSQDHAEALGDHIAVLVTLLQDEEDPIRNNAAMALGELGERALPSLLGAMEEGPETTREASLTALYHVRELPPEAVEVVRPLLESESLRVRLGAAAVVHKATGEVDPGLDAVRDFADGDDETRASVARWLWWVAPEAGRAAPWLRAVLDDEVEDVRVLAAAALRRMDEGDARTREILGAVGADREHPLHGIESWAPPGQPVAPESVDLESE